MGVCQDVQVSCVDAGWCLGWSEGVSALRIVQLGAMQDLVVSTPVVLVHWQWLCRV
jgi:hypothetical protein